MKAETVKRMILLSVDDPPEDLEELVELYARLWSRENGEEPGASQEDGGGDTGSVPPGTVEGEGASAPPEPDDGEPDDGEPEDEELPKTMNAAKGFVHFRCRGCGAERTFYTKGWINQYTCPECGEKMWLRGLHRAKASCKCGTRSNYTTNIEDSGFDIPCVRCGAPMPVFWVPGRNRYEYAGWAPPGSRGRRK